MVAGLLYTPWMIRQIGVSDYGLYALIGAFLSYFMLDFGLDQAIARFIARYRAAGDEKNINLVLAITTRLYLIIDVAIFLVLAVIYLFLANIFKELTPGEIEKLKVIYLIAGFFSIASFPLKPVNGAMIAYERFVVLKMSDMAHKVLIIVLMVIALLAGYGLFALIIVNGLVGFGVKLFNFIYLKRKEGLKINLRVFDKTIASSLLGFSIWIFVIGIAQRLIFNIVPTILGILSGTREIAIFAVAMLLEAYTWTFANALNGLFLPKVSRMVAATDDRHEVTILMIRVGRIQLLVTGMLITGFLVFGRAFIHLWMGPDFSTSYYVALFMILPGLVTLTQSIGSTLVVVVNKVKGMAIIMFLAGIISTAIGILLAPEMGAMGAAIGVGTALILAHVLGMNIFYIKALKLDILRFFKETHLRMILPMLAAGLTGYAIQFYLPITTWFMMLAIGSCFIWFYTLLMWLFAMNSEEKGLVLGLIPGLRK
jgi:O-antigen/teichoic acid export membrane protein